MSDESTRAGRWQTRGVRFEVRIGSSISVTGMDLGDVAGRPVAVVAHYQGPTIVDLVDRTVTVADPPVFAYSVACFETGRGRDAALLGCEDGTISLLDLTTGRIEGSFRAHDRRVTAIVVDPADPAPGSAPGFVSAGLDGDLYACSLSGDSARRIQGAHDGPSLALCLTRVGGELVLVSGGYVDAVLRFWDAVTLTERCAHIPTAMGRVHALTRLGPPDSGVVLVGGNDGSLLTLDAARGRPISGPHQASAPGVECLATARLDGRRLALCGRIVPDRRGPRAWDLDTARVLPGHVGPIPGRDVAIAVTDLGGRPSAVVADDHVLRVVDLDLTELETPPVT